MDMRSQELVTKDDLRRFQVTISVIRIQRRRRHNRDGTAVKQEDGKAEMVFSGQETDWRLFGARKMTDEVLMKLVKRVQKVLVERLARRKVDTGGSEVCSVA